MQNELILTLNANQFTTKNQFCNIMAQECSFPSYFGGGLDAMNDCMRDLAWYNDDKIIIQIRNFHQLNAKNPTMYQLVREMIECWQEHWQSNTEKQVIFEIA